MFLLELRNRLGGLLADGQRLLPGGKSRSGTGIQEQLRILFQRAYPEREALAVSQPNHIDSGWESDLYAFDLKYGVAGQLYREALILRLYPGQDAHEKSGREFRNLVLLEAAGFPVPKTMLFSRDDSPFGKPYLIMERIPGQTLWPRLFPPRGEAPAGLLTAFCQLFLHLHQLDWRPFLDEGNPPVLASPTYPIDRVFGQWRKYLEDMPIPDFDPVMDWLDQRRDRITLTRLAVVHWDFHPENIILRPDGKMVAIDWTGLDVVDPRFDLAWTRLLIYAYEGSQRSQAILDEYNRLAGSPVKDLEFFEAAACLRRLYSVAVSVAQGAGKVGMRPGAEQRMQRQRKPLRRVYQLLLDRTGIKIPIVEEWF